MLQGDVAQVSAQHVIARVAAVAAGVVAPPEELAVVPGLRCAGLTSSSASSARAVLVFASGSCVGDGVGDVVVPAGWKSGLSGPRRWKPRQWLPS